MTVKGISGPSGCQAAHALLLNVSFFLPIVVHDGVESMSDGQYCAVSELPPYGLLNELISFQVHRGRGFVKDQKFTVT